MFDRGFEDNYFLKREMEYEMFSGIANDIVEDNPNLRGRELWELLASICDDQGFDETLADEYINNNALFEIKD